MLVLPGQVDVAGGVGVVDIGLVEHHQSLGGGLDDAAHLSLAQPSTRRAVWVGDEHDPDVGADGRGVDRGVQRHGGPIGGLVDQDRDAPLSLGKQVVDGKAGGRHQHTAAGLAERPDDQRDDLGLPRAAHHLVGLVAVAVGDLLPQGRGGPGRIEVEAVEGFGHRSLGFGGGAVGVLRRTQLGDVVQRDAVAPGHVIAGQAGHVVLGIFQPGMGMKHGASLGVLEVLRLYNAAQWRFPILRGLWWWAGESAVPACSTT